MAKRRIDQAMCYRARLLAGVHPLQTVAMLLRVHPSEITRIKQRGWRAADYASRVRPRPTDFAIQSAHMTTSELLRHYRCGAPVLRRWFAMTPDRRPSWRGIALRK